MFKEPQKEKAFSLYKQGIPLDEIANESGINVHTLKHLIYNGNKNEIPWNALFSLKSLDKYFEDLGDDDTNPTIKGLRAQILYLMRLELQNALMGDNLHVSQELCSLWRLYVEIGEYLNNVDFNDALMAVHSNINIKDRKWNDQEFEVIDNLIGKLEQDDYHRMKTITTAELDAAENLAKKLKDIVEIKDEEVYGTSEIFDDLIGEFNKDGP